MHVVASPRHADLLLVTGPVTRNMETPLRKTYEATPDPKLVVAVGECARTCGVFKGSYAIAMQTNVGTFALYRVDAWGATSPGTFTKLAEGSRREPGCRMYVVHQHIDSPRKFLVYEQYDNEAALQSHRDSAHFQRYAVNVLPTLGERVEGNLYRTL